MYLIAIAAVLVALVVWRGRGKPVLRNGGWRAGAGLFAIGALSAAGILAVKGNGEEAMGLMTVGGLLLFAARTPRTAPSPRMRPSPSPPAASPERLSLAEARSILGVSPSASAQEIRRAYARLIQRAHPDHGGTNRMAAQLNAARDRLLKTVRPDA